MGLLADTDWETEDPHADVPRNARTFAALRDQLDDADRDVLDGWLMQPIPARGQTNVGMGTRNIVDRLREAGHKVTDSQVHAYRRWMQQRG